MTDWRTRAACRGMDVEVFFADTGGGNRAARDICVRCPVRRACLAEALRFEGDTPREARSGVYGGLGPQERYNLRRRTRQVAS